METLRNQIQNIPDPELPFLTIKELRILREFSVEGNTVKVALVPTFSGCPVIERVKEDIEQLIIQYGMTPDVSVLQQAWSSANIDRDARRKMKEHGIAPPGLLNQCPYCDSRDVLMENLFGPTACRQIFYCRTCRNPFEKFKEL